MFHYTIADGLPSDHVFDVFQDSGGFIWFATESGVARFDGEEFEVFNTANGLTSEEVLSIREDHQGRVWMLTLSGIPCFWMKGKIYNPDNTPFLGTIRSEGFLAAFHSDPNEGIFLGYYDGAIFRITPEDSVEKLEACHGAGCLPNLITGLPGGKVISVTSSREIWVYDHGKIEIIKYSEIHFQGPENYPPKAILRSNGEVIYTFGRKAIVLDRDLNRTDFLKGVPGIEQGKIIFLGENDEGKLWVGTTMGAYRYGEAGFGSMPEACFLPGQHVSGIAQDNEGGLWMATRNGVWHCPDYNVQIAELKNGPLTSTLRLENDRILLAGKDGSIAEVSMSDLTVTFTPTSALNTEVEVPIRRIVDRGPKGIWALGERGVFRYRTGQLEFCHRTGVKDFDLHPDGATGCVCMYGGWQTIPTDSMSVEFFGSKLIDDRLMAHRERCFGARYDRTGRLWVLSGDRITISGAGSMGSEFSFKSNGIGSMLPDKDGGMWLSIPTKGILHLDEYLRPQWVQGLPDGGGQDAFSLFAGDKDDIWAANKLGLYRINGDMAILRLPAGSLPVTDVLGVIEQEKSIWVLTTDGPCLVPKTSRGHHPRSPRPFMTRVSVTGEDTLLEEPLVLPYHNNTLEFAFRGLSFQEQKTMAYRYRLRGLEDHWQHTGGEVIRYSSLPAGVFIFELQVRYPNGPWSKSLVLPAITIQTPYWQTWWFLLLAGLTGLGLLGLIFWQFLKGTRRRNHLVLSAMRAEHQALILQMNPHFIFNSLNSVQNYFLNDEKETANDFLADFSALMRSTLENSRSAEIVLSDELKQLDLYLRLEAMRLENRFTHRFELDPRLEVDQIRLPSMLLQPILENAVWHGLAHKSEKGEVLLRIKREGDFLSVLIRDNGVGREKARELRKTRKNHKPMATEIMKDRIGIINKMNRRKISYSIEDLFHENGEAAGTAVSLLIPLSQSPEK